MAIRPILPYPHLGLSEICPPVTAFDGQLQELVADLIDTMRAAPGVGITAAHIGVKQRVFVLELTPGTVLTYINPEVVSQSTQTMRHMEGSVSMPGFTDEVERPSEIEVRFQDISGGEHRQTAEGFHAICIQHEIDQLDGIFWLKRLSKLKRDRLVKKWEKSRKS
ncbi:peptide deformylase [Agrobacterium tumefaciens]|uniref:Peptide deformylase-like n=1 Tax=Agrobacterium tumefaciens TaxID=358 RepID=A0A2L2LBD5_AGRTU|nr:MULTISPECIES: peptide deformylase [Agrobacterium]MCZ7500911.1 peptide deformylase [Rhizobium rhizogenes]AVH41637.1 polypeptide deformylase [Agrobacterium tumefaciens]NSY95569.1 peptide deformylase [Agrobacterium tumefaciens]NSZ00770.1 peptide deformylase [Agrobacterium tumefaciens]NSZ37462.1 peptide deformylase [Agrobacterium tumefaciens]